MGSSSSQTVGFRYYMALHFGICHGPIDALRRIFVGDREAWAGSVTQTSSAQIKAPDLFGGDEKEGGWVGKAHVMMGDAAQTLPSAVAALLPSPAPAFRGIFSLLYDGQITANNPYIKPVAFKLQRIFAGWAGGSCWYPEKAPIGAITAGTSALTLLQSRFLDGSAADESFYARGNPTGAGRGEVTDGAFDVDIVHADYPFVPSALVYEPEDLIPNGTGALTFEMIATCAAVPNVSSVPLGELQLAYGDNTSLFAFQYFDGERLKFKHQATEYVSPAAVAGPVHMAMVFTATELRVYFAGSLVATLARAAVPAAVRMRVRIGDWTGYSSGVTQYTVHGFRLRQEEVYTGASFTPPTEIPDPDGGGASTGWLSMNPAHIIYQCLTDPVWGMAYPTSSIDAASFTAAADVLYAESFGLCLLWNRQEELGAFIRTVLDHIGGLLYSDPKTGKFALKLLRDDYDPEALDTLDTTNVVEMRSFQRVGYGDTVNEITVVYRDVETNKDTPITVQNLANVQAQGAVVSQTRQYPGLPNAALALRVAQRDLIAASTPLAKVTLVVNRSAWAKFPGDVFRLTWPPLGLVGIVMRVLGVDTGRLEDGRVIIEAAEDVFGLPAGSYAAQEPSGWQEPDTTPDPIVEQDVLEVPYRVVAGAMTAAQLQALDDDAAYISALGAKVGTASAFGLYTRAGSDPYARRGTGAFAPYAETAGALAITDTSIALTAGIDLARVQAGTLAIIGSGRTAELVRVDSIDPAAPSMVVSRGMLDTVPAARASGAPVWFDDGRAAPELIERLTGEVIDVKLATMGGGGVLPLAQATPMQITAEQRAHRPYPPGQVRVNGAAYPSATITDALSITWAHRDRRQQTAGYIDQAAGSIGPEAGTTYSVELRRADTTALLASASGLTGTSYAPTLSQAGTFTIRVQLWAVRGGLESWQRHDFTVQYLRNPVITRAGVTLTAAASQVFPAAGASIALALTQTAQAARPASGYRARLYFAYLGSSPTSSIQAGSVLSIFFTYYPSPLVGQGTTISYQPVIIQTQDQVRSTLAQLIDATPALDGWTVIPYNTGASGYLEVIGPVGEQWAVDGMPPYPAPASSWWGFRTELITAGGPAIASDQPQIITATVSGTPNPGDRYTLTLDGQAFVYTAVAGDTASSVAAGLAARVDPSPSYSASSAGAVATITGAGASSFAYVAAGEGAHAYGNVANNSNVRLLMHFEGGIADSSPSGQTITANGGFAASTTRAKWGTGGFTSNGSAWGSVSNPTQFNLGALQWSFDCQIYIPTSVTLATDNCIAAKWGAGGVNISWYFGVASNGRLRFFHSTDGATGLYFDASDAAVPRDQFVHVAVWRLVNGSSDLVVAAINGVAYTVHSTSIGTIFASSVPLTIGAVDGGAAPLPSGITIDEPRFVVGAIDYGNGNFTPPTGPYPD